MNPRLGRLQGIQHNIPSMTQVRSKCVTNDNNDVDDDHGDEERDDVVVGLGNYDNDTSYASLKSYSQSGTVFCCMCVWSFLAVEPWNT